MEKRTAGRHIESPSGQKRQRTNLTIDPVYKVQWEEHGDMSLSQLLEWAIHARLSATVKLSPLNPELPEALKPAERNANYRARKSEQK